MASSTEGVSGAVEAMHGLQLSNEDPYRSHMTGEGEKDTAWRHGGPPSYHVVNSLFEQTRTQEWCKGSLERVVQDLVKTWEMELSHKTKLEDFKTLHPQKFRFSVNGGPWLTGQETLKVGSYNALLQTKLEGEHGAYKASQETFESSHDVFRAAFPGGFAWEVLEVYPGPPTVAFKWRHWGVMEGPFKGHPPSHDTINSIGTCIAKVLLLQRNKVHLLAANYCIFKPIEITKMAEDVYF
ncbi:hypothetical protein KP509_34G072300 [Ceratopteris richardii]|uniref:Pathogen-related protein n=1 Tax=Ceratopteris richardii TaxID=49495 RepID=A0A8T2QLL1_CERRI|nr:hypothetical protein KP509_34G072300 [Ceratopteris richardii]